MPLKRQKSDGKMDRLNSLQAGERHLPGEYTSESKGNSQKRWERTKETTMCLGAGGGGDSQFRDHCCVRKRR